MIPPEDGTTLEEIECDLFVEALRRRHGYDFREYSRASLIRRIRALATAMNVDSISELTTLVLHEPDRIGTLIAGLSVPVSEFFRDPHVFLALKERVFPLLASYPEINIWQAGCAHGEEIYSLAILLTEAGLYKRSRIFATDISEQSLAQAKDGIFPAKDVAEAARRYHVAGGARTFSDYAHARYDFIRMDQDLAANVTFANHNLVTDGVFCEANLILCRNVMIYFTNPLQNRVLSLFGDSLVRGGFLCIGTRESLQFCPAKDRFQLVDAASQLYRKMTND